MIDPGSEAAKVGAALREAYLFGQLAGLEAFDVAPAEFPTVMGFMYAEGVGTPRWTFDQWVLAAGFWIESRSPVEKSPRIRSGGAQASKAYPNWLKPHEIEAWNFARNRAGLRIDGLEDQTRSRLRAILANTITLARPRAETLRIVTEQLTTAFDGLQKDWARIARNELAACFSEGVVVAASAQGVRKFRVVLQTSACSKCRDAYGGKVFTLAELMPILPPALHPNCLCVPKPVT